MPVTNTDYGRGVGGSPGLPVTPGSRATGPGCGSLINIRGRLRAMIPSQGDSEGRHHIRRAVGGRMDSEGLRQK